MFKEYLNELFTGNNLTEEKMRKMMDEILSGEITNSQIGAFMGALAAKGETFEELAGAALAMRKKAVRIHAPGNVVVDTCGTGGDMSDTFNISTTTAFVVAGCNVTVAKHGNRSVSSKSGSADLLEALDVKIDIDPEVVEEAISEIGIGFLFAPLYHNAMKYAVTPRKEIGLRSIFNMLGPLTNPAAANCQLLGVYAPDLTEMLAQALLTLGAKRAFVVHGHEGLDEISICAPTRVSELKEGQIRTYDIMPEQFFSEEANPDDIKGGSPDENAIITKEILNGKKGPARDVVLINAAAALTAAGKANDLSNGIKLAENAIDTGAAAEKLQKLVEFTNENG